MVFMTMRNDKPLYLFHVFFQIRSVRNNKIDSEHVILRECQTAVHDHNTVPELERGDIHANLFKSAERDDPQGRSRLPAAIFIFFFQFISYSEDLSPPARICIPACSLRPSGSVLLFRGFF